MVVSFYNGIVVISADTLGKLSWYKKKKEEVFPLQWHGFDPQPSTMGYAAAKV